nr:recombinase family protein [Paramesorhizobium deserti]
MFRDYAAGKSAKTIAVALNKEGVPAPTGGDCGFSTINGNPKRGNGILVWNRQRFIRDPDTGKRQAAEPGIGMGDPGSAGTPDH